MSSQHTSITSAQIDVEDLKQTWGDLEKGAESPTSSEKQKPTLFQWIFGDSNTRILRRKFLGGRIGLFPFLILCSTLVTLFCLLVFIIVLLVKVPEAMQSLTNMQTITFNDINVKYTTNTTMQMAVSLSDSRIFGVPVSGRLAAPLMLEIMSPTNPNNVAIRFRTTSDINFSGNEPNNINATIVVELVDPQGILALLQCQQCSSASGMPVTSRVTANIDVFGMRVISGSSFTITQNMNFGSGKFETITDVLNMLPQGIFRPNLNKKIRQENSASKLISFGDDRIPDIHITQIKPANNVLGASINFEFENPLMLSMYMAYSQVSVGLNGTVFSDIIVTSALQNASLSLVNAPGVLSLNVSLYFNPHGDFAAFISSISNFVTGSGSLDVSNIMSVIGGGFFVETLAKNYVMHIGKGTASDNTNYLIRFANILNSLSSDTLLPQFLGSQSGLIIISQLLGHSNMEDFKITNFAVTSMTDTTMGVTAHAQTSSSLNFTGSGSISLSDIHISLANSTSQPLLIITPKGSIQFSGNQPFNTDIESMVNLIDIPTIQNIVQRVADSTIGTKGGNLTDLQFQISTNVTFNALNSTILNNVPFSFPFLPFASQPNTTDATNNQQNFDDSVSGMATEVVTKASTMVFTAAQRDNLNSKIRSANPRASFLQPMAGGPDILIQNVKGTGLGFGNQATTSVKLAMENPMMGELPISKIHGNLLVNNSEKLNITIVSPNSGSPLMLQNKDGAQNVSASILYKVTTPNAGNMVANLRSLKATLVGPVDIQMNGFQSSIFPTITKNLMVEMSRDQVGMVISSMFGNYTFLQSMQKP